MNLNSVFCTVLLSFILNFNVRSNSKNQVEAKPYEQPVRYFRSVEAEPETEPEAEPEAEPVTEPVAEPVAGPKVKERKTVKKAFLSIFNIAPDELSYSRRTSIIYFDNITTEPTVKRKKLKKKKKNKTKHKTYQTKTSNREDNNGQKTRKQPKKKNKHKKKKNRNTKLKSWNKYPDMFRNSASKSGEVEKGKPVDIIVHIKMKNEK